MGQKQIREDLNFVDLFKEYICYYISIIEADDQAQYILSKNLLLEKTKFISGYFNITKIYVLHFVL